MGLAIDRVDRGAGVRNATQYKFLSALVLIQQQRSRDCASITRIRVILSTIKLHIDIPVDPHFMGLVHQLHTNRQL